jgi:hypothetical protein
MRKCEPMTAAEARQRAWQSMRVLRRFTLPDLQATAEIGRDNVGRYVRGLLRAQYLRIAKPKVNGHVGGHAIYQLVRNTGPHAPRLQHGGAALYDPNNDTEVEFGEVPHVPA